MAFGKPAISTPNTMDLRAIQAPVSAARQRIEKLEAAVAALQANPSNASAILALQEAINNIVLSSGTVTNVSATVPSFMSVSGTPITTAGTLAFSFADQPSGEVLIGPVSGADAPPTFRRLQWDYDLPLFSSVSSISGVDGTELVLIERYGRFYWVTASQITDAAQHFIIQAACSDEITALTTGTAKITFRMPAAMHLTAVRASLTTAQASGSIFTVDIKKNGTSILSTKITIDNTELTSTTAATPPVISDSNLADDASITVNIDQVGTSGAKGLKIALIGTY